ncbi:MAG: aspartate--tRNA ligase [Spirochaetales bacterium]|nr:MAG: aspartate--tRNA ligase [Spirochaetales bacterium]
MKEMQRTHTCGALTGADAGKKVILNGWVHRNRDHGGIQFINLRDRYGITQVVVDEDAPETLKALTKTLKFEYCVAVSGTVRKRPDSMVNADMTTGAIELAAETITVLSECETLPFMIDEASEAKEELRMKYRYLDLRSFSMQRKMRLRQDVTFRTREYLVSRGFYEIETPTLIKSTPEGARDFLVPARLYPGKFFALPQSPQLYKQILMVSGMDKYFQIARCYRDEDARGDRQLEFTQIDIEMSFVSQDDIFGVVEGMMAHIFTHTLGIKVPIPFERLTYHETMNRYGSDKPDLRISLELKDFTESAKTCGFGVFKTAAEGGGAVKALVVPGGSSLTRKQIDDYEAAAKLYGAKGLAWFKNAESGLEGGIAKFFQDTREEVCRELGVSAGDAVLFVADSWKTACTALGAVRSKMGRELQTLNPQEFKFCWIVDFPLFEWNEDEKKWDPAHHMFTMPQEQFIATLEQNPGEVKGEVYDLVCNGYELASGSIRIHQAPLQERIFTMLGFSKEEARRRFGFLLEAFKYGPPPHGGIAPGLDRLVMLMAEETTIREVIAFPKSTAGVSLMDDCPSEVDEKQLKELHIRAIKPET